MVTVGWESGEKLVRSTAWDTGCAIHNNKASKTKDDVVLESSQPSVEDISLIYFTEILQLAECRSTYPPLPQQSCPRPEE